MQDPRELGGIPARDEERRQRQLEKLARYICEGEFDEAAQARVPLISHASRHRAEGTATCGWPSQRGSSLRACATRSKFVLSETP